MAVKRTSRTLVGVTRQLALEIEVELLDRELLAGHLDGCLPALEWTVHGALGLERSPDVQARHLDAEVGEHGGRGGHVRESHAIAEVQPAIDADGPIHPEGWRRGREVLRSKRARARRPR